METTSAARNRPKATARSSAAITGARPWMASSVESSSRSRARPVIPRAAAPLMKASATGPRAQKVFSASVLRPDRALRVWVSALRSGRR